MEVIVALICLAAGAGINVLADALPLRHRLARPRCLHCGGPRPPQGWIGLLAAASRAGRCTYCGVGQGPRPAIVEGVSIGFGLWLFSRNPDPSIFVPGLIVGWVFLLIAVIDIEHRLILRIVVVPASIVMAIVGSVQPDRGLDKTLLGGAVGLVVLWLMYLLGIVVARWISRRRGRALEEVAFGFGDVLLGGLIGLIVGWPGILIAIVMGVLAAGVYSLGFLAFMLMRRKYTPYTPIPYGPFLLLGASVVYYGGRTALERIAGGG